MSPTLLPTTAPPLPAPAAVPRPVGVRRYTPEDLLRLPDGGKGFELIDGALKELPVSYLSSFIAGRVYGRLSQFVEANNLGWVSPEGTSYRCFPAHPDRVRRADVSFHRLDRLTPEQARTEGFCPVVPDLVVEVVSPNDLSGEVTAKLLEWLDAGAALVWVIHPEQQTINAYPAGELPTLIKAGGELTGTPVLPDFRVAAAELFRLPGGG